MELELKQHFSDNESDEGQISMDRDSDNCTVKSGRSRASYLTSQSVDVRADVTRNDSGI